MSDPRFDAREVPTEQYRDSRNLAKRAGLAQKYATKDWFGWLRGQLSLCPGMRVLDVGCGAGWVWRADDLPAIDLTLTDASPGMVDEALANTAGFPRRTGLAADADSLPFAPASFDLITALHMVYHLPDPDRALARWAGLLAPGGRIAITTNAAANIAPIWAIHARVFGGAAVDPATVPLDAQTLTALLQRHFGAVEIVEFRDHYRITDKDDVLAFLQSLPWATQSDSATQAQLARSVEAAMGPTGTLEVPRSALLLRAWSDRAGQPVGPGPTAQA